VIRGAKFRDRFSCLSCFSWSNPVAWNSRPFAQFAGKFPRIGFVPLRVFCGQFFPAVTTGGSAGRAAALTCADLAISMRSVVPDIP